MLLCLAHRSCDGGPAESRNSPRKTSDRSVAAEPAAGLAGSAGPSPSGSPTRADHHRASELHPAHRRWPVDFRAQFLPDGGQCVCRNTFVSATVNPSTPALPRLAFTRFHPRPCSHSRAPAPSGRLAPSLRHPVASTPLHHVHRTPGFHPDPPAPVPVARARCLHRRSTRASTLLLVRPFVLPLLRPLLTSRSVSPRRPFSHEARSPRVRTHSVPAQPPDLRRLSLDHESFAVFGLLALLGTAFYPVLVHRLAGFAPRFPPRSVTLTQLRFASLAVINSRWDLHPQECARAGRTKSTTFPRKRRA